MSLDLGQVNILSAEHKRDPFPFYARLRAESPVARLTAPVLGPLWIVTKHADVVACLKQADRFVKDPRNAGRKHRQTLPRWLPPSIRALEQNMLDTDDPTHRRLRSLVNKAFGPSRVEGLRNRMAVITEELLDRAFADGEAELVSAFALPLPLTVICELLGIPVADRQRFHRWSSALIATTSSLRMVLAVPPIIAFARYLRRLCQARRQDPQDDLVTALVEAEEAGERLSETEIVAMLLLLVVAGHETTVNLIGSGTLALLEHPEQMRGLIEHPERIGAAVDELLRYTAPVETATERYAAEDMELGGAQLRKGDVVLAAIASANRDEAVFEDADVLDLGRKADPHVAFGHGVHFCLGHLLARLEAEIAFTRLLERCPDLRLIGDANDLTWRESPIVRGLTALPVAA
jgi:cytochrome P450